MVRERTREPIDVQNHFMRQLPDLKLPPMHPIPTLYPSIPFIPLPLLLAPLSLYPIIPLPLLCPHLIRAGFRHKQIGLMERFDRPSVSPPALQNIPGQCAIRDVSIIDVGNFELTTA